MKDEYNIKKSKTIKSCKALLQKKNNYNKNEEKTIFASFADNESDDRECFSDFVDSELISGCSNDDWLPKVVITMI